MALNKHPTKTFRIEKAWLSQINRRFGEFKKVVKGKLKDLNKTAMVLNAAEPFALNPQQIQAFMLFYQQQINELITGTASPPNWQAQYQLQSYQRGIERGMASLRAQGINVPDLSTATTSAAIPGAACPNLEAVTFKELKELLRGPSDMFDYTDLDDPC